MPGWFWDLVQLSTEIPLHLPVSTTLLKQSHNKVFSKQSTTFQPPHLVSRSGQLQGFSVEVAGKIAWALFKKWCSENSVDFSTPSVKHVLDFFMYLYQDQNRHPLTIDGYKTAFVDTLGSAGLHISQTLTLTGYFLAFTAILLSCQFWQQALQQNLYLGCKQSI